ncbi:MAG: MFS transporter [Fimbriimonadaceae bacterium]|nr:MFS transporter [Fimbriimonadaceae bacterium]
MKSPYVRVLFVAWLGWVFDIMDTVLFNFAKLPMLTEMLGAERFKAVGPQIEGQIQTIFLIAWSIGGLLFGILADRWGRAPVLITTILMYSVFTGLTGLCQTPEQVMVARFITALGIGGEWAAGAAWVAESVPDEFRARASGFLQSAAAFGPWFATIANLAVPAGQWRTLFFVGALPAVMCVAMRWKTAHAPGPAATQSSGDFGDLFRSAAQRRRTWVAVTLGVVGVTGAGIVPFWLPNLIEQVSIGMSPEAKKQLLSLNTFTIHLGTLAGVLLFPILADRFGRRPLFAAFFIGAPVMGALALLGAPDLTRLIVLLPISTFFSIGLSAGFVLYFPELFPARIRATGAGLAYNVGRVVSAPVPAVMGWLMTQSGNSVGAVVAAAGSIYVIGLVALTFAPETRGQPLPE